MTAINPKAVRGPVTAVPVVAGKGIRFVEDVPNNRVVAELDETVLFEDSDGHSMNTPLEVSENFENFRSFKIYYNVWGGAANRVLEFFVDPSGNCVCSNAEQFDQNGLNLIMWRFDAISSSSKKTLSCNYFAYFNGSFSGTTLNKEAFQIFRVIGCNRIAST